MADAVKPADVVMTEAAAPAPKPKAKAASGGKGGGKQKVEGGTSDAAGATDAPAKKGGFTGMRLVVRGTSCVQ